jgi:hypothetical protein
MNERTVRIFLYWKDRDDNPEVIERITDRPFAREIENWVRRQQRYPWSSLASVIFEEADRG